MKGIGKNMKPYDVGLICGRFQTFHIGHESLVETGIKLCDRILILIGSAQECGTERNPFNINTRTKMLRNIYGNSENILIYGISDLTDENDIRPEWGRYLLENVDRYIYKAPELMIYGNDESRSKWFDPEDIRDTSEFIVNRGRIPISATMVREAMVFDRRKEWMSMVNPKLHKMYPELRDELMSVQFYKKMFDGGR
jgi:cytidyltransferase-like protein